MKEVAKKWLLGAVLLCVLVAFLGPVILGAIGIAAKMFGFGLPAWPILVIVFALLVFLALLVFMSGVAAFTSLLQWLHSQPLHRFAEWWLSLSEDQRAWKALKFLGVVVGAIVILWLIQN